MNTDKVARLNSQIRNIILDEPAADFDINNPLNEMWLGVEKIAAAVRRLDASAAVVTRQVEAIVQGGGR